MAVLVRLMTGTASTRKELIVKQLSERIKEGGKVILLPFAAGIALGIALLMRFGGKPARY